MKQKTTFTFFILAYFTAIIAGCAPEGGDGGSKPQADPAPLPQSDNPTPTPGDPKPSPSSGTLSIPLPGTLALGVAETGLGLLDSADRLVAINATGEITTFGLPDPENPEEVANVGISNIYPLGGQAGAVIDLGHLYYDPATTAYWLQSDGTLRPFAPEGYDRNRPFHLWMLEVDAKGVVWLIGSPNANQGSLDFPAASTLYKFDPETAQFTELTPEGLGISDFAITSDDSIFVSGMVISTEARFTRRLRSDATFEQLHGFYGELGVFGRFVVLGDTFYQVNATTDATIVDRLSEWPWVGPTGQTPIVVGGRWWATWKRNGIDRASKGLDLRDRKISGNPFTTIDALALNNAGLTFDGANLITISENAGTISGSQTKRLATGTTPVLKIRRVFGAVHGFTDTTVALGQPAGTDNLYLVTIDAEGEVDLQNKLLFDFTISNTGNNNPSCYSLIKLATKTFLLNSCAGSDVPVTDALSTVTDDGEGNAVLTAVSLSNFPEVYTLYSYMRPAVFGDKLYLTNGNNFVEVDADGNESLLTPPQLDFEVDANCANRAIAAIGPDHQSISTKPVIFMRPCSAELALTEGTSLFAVRFTDWTFTTVDTYVEVTTAKQVPHKLFYGSENELIIVADKAHVIISSTTDLTVTNAATNLALKDFSQQGVLYYGDKVAGEFDLLIPWDGTSFIYSGITPANEYKTYRVDLVNATEAELPDLTGIQVFSGYSDAANTFLINGLDVANNKMVLMRFDPDGTLVGSTQTNVAKIRKIIPFDNQQ